MAKLSWVVYRGDHQLLRLRAEIIDRCVGDRFGRIDLWNITSRNGYARPSIQELNSTPTSRSRQATAAALVKPDGKKASPATVTEQGPSQAKPASGPAGKQAIKCISKTFYNSRKQGRAAWAGVIMHRGGAVLDCPSSLRVVINRGFSLARRRRKLRRDSGYPELGVGQWPGCPCEDGSRQESNR